MEGVAQRLDELQAAPAPCGAQAPATRLAAPARGGKKMRFTLGSGKTRQAPPPAAPEAMEGVVATAPLALKEDPVEEWEDMEGVEREGLFASQHTPELGATGTALTPVQQAPKEMEKKKKKKDKGNERAVQTVLPPGATPTPGHQPKGAPHQQRCQAAIDETRVEAAQLAPSPPPPVRSILKRPESAAV